MYMICHVERELTLKFWMRLCQTGTLNWQHSIIPIPIPGLARDLARGYVRAAVEVLREAHHAHLPPRRRHRLHHHAQGQGRQLSNYFITISKWHNYITGHVLLRDAQLGRLPGIHDQPPVLPERLLHHQQGRSSGQIFTCGEVRARRSTCPFCPSFLWSKGSKKHIRQENHWKMGY